MIYRLVRRPWPRCLYHLSPHSFIVTANFFTSSEVHGLQIDLTYQEAEKLANSAQEGETDGLIADCGIRIADWGRGVGNEADDLIQSAIDEVLPLCSFCSELRRDCARALARRFREKQ